MLTINHYIKNTTDKYISRENIEWSNFWYDYANRSEKKRVLLIGDSTIRMVRSTFSKKYNIAADMIGSSSNLHDILFKAQVDAFFSSERYSYDAIFIQVGDHFKKNDRGGGIEEGDFSIFKEDYSGLIDFLLQYTNQIILLSIFEEVIVPKHDNIKNEYFMKLIQYIDKVVMLIQKPQYDISKNRIITRRNEIIKQIADEKLLMFCDINEIMKMTHYKRIDHIHFQKAARKFICQQ